MRSGSGLPGNRAIGTAIAMHAAALATISPSAPLARRTLVGRIPPFGLLSLFAIARTAAVDHPLFVSIVLVPTNAPLIISVVVASLVTLRTSPLANGSVGRFADSAATSWGPALVRTRIAAVPIIVRCVGHFVGSNFTGRIGSPIPLGDKLHDRRRRNSSKKQQRIVAHGHFLDTSNAGPILRIDAVTDSRNPSRTRALWTFLVRG